jgi:hypothetical protein
LNNERRRRRRNFVDRDVLPDNDPHVEEMPKKEEEGKGDQGLHFVVESQAIMKKVYNRRMPLNPGSVRPQSAKRSSGHLDKASNRCMHHSSLFQKQELCTANIFQMFSYIPRLSIPGQGSC